LPTAADPSTDDWLMRRLAQEVISYDAHEDFNHLRNWFALGSFCSRAKYEMCPVKLPTSTCNILRMIWSQEGFLDRIHVKLMIPFTKGVRNIRSLTPLVFVFNRKYIRS